MDFVEGFPRVNGKSMIGHPYTVTSVAKVFVNAIVKLYDIPKSIVSDRDPVFMSKFWTEMFTMSGTKLQLSSAFHPQTGGWSESTNRIVTMYLRCLISDRLRQWLQWLPWVEYCYNTSFHSSI
jgi:hypothetical protein